MFLPNATTSSAEDKKSRLRNYVVNQNVVCRFFLQGCCRYGDDCKFLHVRQSPSETEVQIEKMKHVNVKKSSTSPSPKNETIEIKPEKIEDSTKQDNSQPDAKETKMMLTKEEKKLVPCKYFVRGFCARGRHCRYLHDKSLKKSLIPNRFKPKIKKQKDNETTKDGTKEENLKTEKKNGQIQHSDPNTIKLINKVIVQRPQINIKDDKDLRQLEIKMFLKKFPESRKINDEVDDDDDEKDNKETNDVKTKVEADNKNDESSDSQSKTTKSDFYKFTFTPSDPDWAFAVKDIEMMIEFPADYPQRTFYITVTGNCTVPDPVEKTLTKLINEQVATTHHPLPNSIDGQLGTSSSSPPATLPSNVDPLQLRVFLKWLDKNIEDLLTKALVMYKQDLQLAAAGIRLIPANQLRETYKGAVSSQNQPTNERAAVDMNHQILDTNKTASAADNVENVTISKNTTTTTTSNFTTDTATDTATTLDDTNDSNPTLSIQLPKATPKKDTEIRLNDLTLTNIATLTCSTIKVTVTCTRCTNQSDATCQSNSPKNMIGCLFCKQEGFIHYYANLVHSNDHRLGHFETGGFQVADVLFMQCCFVAHCFNCMKDNVVKSLFPGQPNDTWCKGCHQKMTLKVNNVKVIRIGRENDPATISTTTSTKIKTTTSDNMRVKAVKDPAIQDGKPLPAFGTCRHFRKSFRWFRFPCCGKAYPCDHCHEENESHEMKLANRMICGFCAYEQAYSPSNPCLRCGSNITNKFTSHWEGGKGCRDKVRMSRTDSKKYTNTQKTTSTSSKEKTSSTIATNVKLRHS